MKNKLLIVIILLYTSFISAQDFLLQGWYWDYPKTTARFNWADTLRLKANQLKNSGFTYIWLPPLSRAASGNSSNGYDPKDLYDLGEYGNGATGFGTRTDLNNLITQFNSVGLKAVADVVYNHRDGGLPEQNSAVKNYINNYDYTRANTGYNPYPNDRVRYALPLGGFSGNGAGDYYFKFSSSSGHSRFNGYEYKIYMETKTVGWKNLADLTETEPNGGGDCSQSNNNIELGRNLNGTIDNPSTCRTDEFHLNLTSTDFNSSGDTLFIYISKRGSSDYSDFRPYGIWSSSRSQDIINDLQVQTYTNFMHVSSNQGLMNFENFKPNNTNATKLDGDWDWPWFFYDYDQNITSTKSALIDWTKWLWNNVGIRGFRMDAVKHFPNEFVGDLLDDLHTNSIDPGLIVGEYYDSNVNSLKTWIQNTYTYMNVSTSSAIQIRLFDFSLRDALKNACDTYGYDVRNVFSSGMVDAGGMNGLNVVTFVNNHDFRDAGQIVSNDPILAYAYILTNNQIGMPSVFYPDYYNVPSFTNTNLHSKIDALINVHKNNIYGASSRYYLNKSGSGYYNNFTSGATENALIYQLSGIPSGLDVIVAINFSGLQMTAEVGINQSNSSIVNGTTFSDKIGNALNSYCTVNSGRVTLSLSARSYAVWVQDASPTPVQLVEFKSNVKKGNVTLTWQTATEVNNYGFEIERCVILRQAQDDNKHNVIMIPTLSGLSNHDNWEKIGFVAGHGNSNSPKDYSFIDNNPSSGKIKYRLKQIDFDGSFSYSNEVIVNIETPLEFSLEQNYPNPFNSETIIRYVIPSAANESKEIASSQQNGTRNDAVNVTLKVYDMLGNEVATLVNERQPAGKYVVKFDGKNLSSGVYFYKLQSGNPDKSGQAFVQTRKFILMK